MRRQYASFALMVCGVFILLGVFLTLPVATPASAMPALQPSPRPTLQPTPNLGDDYKPTPIPMGRVTGTIIDLRTNAPVSGVDVAIDDVVVTSNEFGNYDYTLKSGYYTVQLQLAAGQGTPAQAAQRIAVGVDDTVILHLFFTSVGPTPAPTTEIPATALEPTLVPTAPAVLPVILPDTSVADTSAASPAAAAAPSALPVTAAPTNAMNPGMWLLIGVLLLGLGVMLQVAPRLRFARRTVQASDRDVLADLLDREP